MRCLPLVVHVELVGRRAGSAVSVHPLVWPWPLLCRPGSATVAMRSRRRRCTVGVRLGRCIGTAQ